MTTPTSLADQVWLTTEEAATYTRRSAITIIRHAAAGTLKSAQPRPKAHRRYRKEWLDEWTERRHNARNGPTDRAS